VRTQAQVHVEDALLARRDQAGDLTDHGLEEDAGVDARLLGGSAEAIHDHELDVGGVTHLAPAELAEAEDRDGRHASALVSRPPVRPFVEAA
jgi:hypothetical protein